MRQLVVDELDKIHALDIDAECRATLETLVLTMNYLDEMGLLAKPISEAVAIMKEHYFSFSHHDTWVRMQVTD